MITLKNLKESLNLWIQVAVVYLLHGAVTQYLGN